MIKSHMRISKRSVSFIMLSVEIEYAVWKNSLSNISQAFFWSSVKPDIDNRVYDPVRIYR